MGVTIEELDIQVSEGMKGGPEPHPQNTGVSTQRTILHPQ